MQKPCGDETLDELDLITVRITKGKARAALGHGFFSFTPEDCQTVAHEIPNVFSNLTDQQSC